MSYSLYWTERASKDLEKLPRLISQRIINKIESIIEDPHRTAEPCEGHSLFHQRIGTYRAILKIDDSDLLISIVKIGLIKTVYDR